MKRAAPTIVLSAAGLTWLLHAQGVIDTKAATPSASPPPSTTLPTGDAPPTTDPPQAPATAAPRTTPTTSAASSQGRTVDGPVIDTRYGPVQVELVMGAGNRISDVRVLQYPNEARRSQLINEQALPILHDETLSAQSASIDTVSGATYTSDGYGQSLQAALDQAGIGGQ
ncbi:MAG: FMN-binding protein [Acidimicrobiia bacterium]|nr:FMN-binding protein [Acidimicrobiia bacterium]